MKRVDVKQIMNKTAIIKKIEVQSDRILFYIDNSYHVIGSLSDDKLMVNNQIEYEPYGINFGFLVRRLNKNET